MGRIGWVLAVSGCGATTAPVTTPDTVPTQTSVPVPFAGAPLVDIVGGCPEVGASGAVNYRSNGVRRDLILKVPQGGGQGRPVLFFWHGLGGSPTLFDLWLDFQTFADDNDMVVVVPESLDSFGNTWTLGEGADMDLYDHLRSCLSRDLDVDLDRIYTAGFSFGGLFATALTMDRADTLAATMPMSGGTSPLWFAYRAPDNQALPVLVMWGGPTDTYGSGATLVNFETMSLDFTGHLLDDDHLVHACDHGLGHDIPAAWADIAATWFASHSYGEPGGLTAADYPAICFSPP